jgi:diguanylate cyclase (GGDEF)-like protein
MRLKRHADYADWHNEGLRLSDVASISGKRPSLHDGADPLTILDRLLGLLSELAPAAEPRDLADFKTRLEEYRKGLAHTPAGPDLAAVTHSCLQTCERFLETSRKYVRNRDAQLLEQISIIQQTTAAVGGAVSASLSPSIETMRALLVKADDDVELDPLTRVPNQATFERTLQKTVAASVDSGVPVSVAMVDVDDFKRLVDEHGPRIGDRVLRCTAAWLGKVVRRSDMVARYGKTGFAVILKDAKTQQVETRLNHALADLAAHSFEYEDKGETRTVHYTARIGITELTAGDRPEDIIARAGEALAEGQRKGCNRVVTKKRSMLARLLTRQAISKSA